MYIVKHIHYMFSCSFFTWRLTVHSPGNEKLVKSGILHTNFMPGQSTAICMTSNIEIDASMTLEDVQRFTLAALVRDRPADQDTGRDAQECCTS